MKVSYGLPTHQVGAGDELVSGAAIAELAGAAEAAGFAAAYVTEHPIPTAEWLGGGGHHALDPLVALSFAAAATSTLLLHTHLFVAAYRNPFLAAKGIATLDVLSGGRVVLGVGTGYLEGEFDALGVPFDERNGRTDDALDAMREAWTGEPVTRTGPGYRAEGVQSLPRPVQQPGPPVWIGGNSKAAIRRAVERGHGWSPFPNPARYAGMTRTAALESPADLAERLDYAHRHAAEVGRTAPLEVMFIPRGLSMNPSRPVDHASVVSSCRELAAVGVTWLSVAFPDATRAGQLEAIAAFGASVLPEIGPL